MKNLGPTAEMVGMAWTLAQMAAKTSKRMDEIPAMVSRVLLSKDQVGRRIPLPSKLSTALQTQSGP